MSIVNLSLTTRPQYRQKAQRPIDFRSVYLLDWGCAEAHLVPHYDLLELLRWHAPQGEIFQAFCRGYGLGNYDLAVLLPELQSLALLKAFDLTRWAIDRCPQRIAEIAERARAVAQQTVG